MATLSTIKAREWGRDKRGLAFQRVLKQRKVKLMLFNFALIFKQTGINMDMFAKI